MQGLFLMLFQYDQINTHLKCLVRGLETVRFVSGQEVADTRHVLRQIGRWVSGC